MRRLFALALTIFLTATAAGATSYVLLDDADLADQADLVVVGRIAEARVGLDDGRLATRYTVEIDQLVAGDYLGSRLEVRVPGGRSEELGRELRIFAAPEFAAGERVLLMLGQNRDGSWRVLHLMQGAFRLESGGRLAVRSLERGHLVPRGDDLPPASRPEADPPRRLDRFVDWLSDREGGLERAPDYRTTRSSFTAAFTLLSSETPLRWFHYDQGGEVAWFRHRDPQAGLTRGKTARAFRQARRAWQREPNTPVRLVNGGLTDSTTEFVRSDFRNTILFDDRNETIGDDFDCRTGGTVAVGGVSVGLGTTLFWKGEPYFPIDEAEIVINDGVDCFLEGRVRLAAQIYGHELGHTLGLGHSCGDDESPACGRSAELDEALMRAFVHEDGRNARLGSDDVRAIRQLYDPDFFAAPCDLPPGHKKFCRRCGPCGEGQGNCRNSGDCVFGLACLPNAGADFDLPPTANVCVSTN